MNSLPPKTLKPLPPVTVVLPGMPPVLMFSVPPTSVTLLLVIRSMFKVELPATSVRIPSPLTVSVLAVAVMVLLIAPLAALPLPNARNATVESPVKVTGPENAPLLPLKLMVPPANVSAFVKTTLASQASSPPAATVALPVPKAVLVRQSKIPPLTVVPPLKVFAPEIASVPVSVFCKPPWPKTLSLMTPGIVSQFVPATSKFADAQASVTVRVGASVIGANVVGLINNIALLLMTRALLVLPKFTSTFRQRSPPEMMMLPVNGLLLLLLRKVTSPAPVLLKPCVPPNSGYSHRLPLATLKIGVPVETAAMSSTPLPD